MALSNLQASQFKDEMSSLKVDSKMKDSASKALKRMDVEDTDKNRRLLLVLRHYKERVYAEDFKEARDKIVLEVEEEYLLKRVLILNKEFRPDLDREIPVKWFFDPHALHNSERCWS